MKKTSVLAVVLATFLAITPSFAQSIVHRWDMTTVDDIIGTANGTLLSGASLSGGVLTPAAGNGAASFGGGNGNGLNLPAAAVAGLSGAFSIEVWYTWDGTGGFQTLYSFSDTTNNNYLIAVPKRGGDPFQSSAFKMGTEWLATGAPNASGVLTQVVTTYDGAGTAQIYINGVAAGSTSAINPAFDLSSFTQLGIAGNSPWPDETLHGTISDFRIYDGLLNSSQVSALNSLGADATNGQIIAAVPEPGVVALLGGGAAMLLLRRRRS